MEMRKIEIKQRAIAEIKPYPGSPRKNDHAVEAMISGIMEFGFNVPLLIQRDGEIVDGHLRYKAAEKIGLKEVPVIFVDDLTDVQIKAFRLSVNKLSDLAKWDMKLLEIELQQLKDLDFNLSEIGFSEVELDAILKNSDSTNIDIDKIPESSPPVSANDDLWILGDHKLYVGDATQEKSYRRLLGESSVDMVWTDPPYNVNYKGKAGRIENDNMSEDDFSSFLHAFYKNTHKYLKPGGPIYVAHADGSPGLSFRSEFVRAGFYFSTCLIWNKNHSVLGRGDYHFQHEPILYGWKKGSAHRWYGGRKRKSVVSIGDQSIYTKTDENTYQVNIGNEALVFRGENISVESILPTVISFDKPNLSKDHPTMKPVSLVEYFLVNSSRPGDLVLDCFGGSGTTLIACEKRGRQACLMEKDVRFADVILRRWFEYSGENAVLENGTTYQERLESYGRENAKKD